MKKVKLFYVSDETPGFTRKKWGRGFIYLNTEGNKVKDKALLIRFKELVIPPAWQEVWICSDECGHIQATGRDEAGRKQYIYHPEWEKQSSETKFSEMIEFGEYLPAIRERADNDLRKHNFHRERVLALAINLLDESLIRIGNATYTKKYGSFGLTTLREKHLEIHGSKIKFDFTGKKGVEREVEIQDNRLSRIIKQLEELPGQLLFVYHDEEDRRKNLTSSAVNEYLHEITGKDFTAKYFRTWGGSVLALKGFVESGKEKTKTDVKKKVVEVIKYVADELGNTPAICRKYYIHPEIISAYEDGSLFKENLFFRKRKFFDGEEAALLRFLKSKRN